MMFSPVEVDVKLFQLPTLFGLLLMLFKTKKSLLNLKLAQEASDKGSLSEFVFFPLSFGRTL